MKESHLLYNIYEDFPLHVRMLQDNHHIISQLYLSDIIIIPPCCWMFQGVFNLHPRWIADWGRCDGSSLSEAGWLNFRKVLTSSDFNWEQIRIQHDSSVKTLGIDTIYTSIVNHLGLLSRGDSPFPSHSPGHQLLRLCHATVIMVGWPNPGWMWLNHVKSLYFLMIFSSFWMKSCCWKLLPILKPQCHNMSERPSWRQEHFGVSRAHREILGLRLVGSQSRGAWLTNDELANFKLEDPEWTQHILIQCILHILIMFFLDIQI